MSDQIRICFDYVDELVENAAALASTAHLIDSPRVLELLDAPASTNSLSDLFGRHELGRVDTTDSLDVLTTALRAIRSDFEAADTPDGAS